MTIAYLPLGVKYRLYGSCTSTVLPALPVLGSMGVRVLPRSLLTQSVFMSQEGTTCWGWAPTLIVSMTSYVFGSITETVLELVLGTYTRDGKSLTTGESLFGRSAA